MKKTLRILLVVATMLLPLTTKAQNDSMLVNIAVNNPVMGTTTPAPGAHYFHVGDTCHVVAMANEGYVLTGWDIQWSFMGTVLMDTTVNLPMADVFDLVGLINGGDGWVVQIGHNWYSFSVTANFVAASEYVPDSMVVNVAVNNPVIGMTFPGTGTHKFAEGDTCHVVALANEGYHLTGWTIQVAFGGATYIDTTVDIAAHDAFDLLRKKDTQNS